MSHEDARVLLAAEALDALTGRDRDATVAHAAGCAACRTELEALYETAGALAHSVPALSLPDDRSGAVRARLLARAAADRMARDAAASDLATSRERTAPGMHSRGSVRPGGVSFRGQRLAAAALLIATGLGVYALAERRRADALGETLAANHAVQSRLRADLVVLGDSLADREQLLAALTGPSVRMVQLTSTREREPSARMFWDQAHDRWTFVAHNLPAAPSGRTYQLWLITPADQKISAGTFTPRSDGAALVRATYALARDSLAAVAVTEEPTGGVAQPTGEIVVAGRAGR